MILEYKLIKTDRGIHTPNWIEDGGYFYNPVDKTFIGYTPNETDRDYYVPDTVIELTETQLAARINDLGLKDHNNNLLDGATVASIWILERA